MNIVSYVNEEKIFISIDADFKHFIWLEYLKLINIQTYIFDKNHLKLNINVLANLNVNSLNEFHLDKIQSFN